MNYLLFIILLMLDMNSPIIFDFNKKSDINEWRVVNDVVMGGKSSGNFKLSEEGHGLFTGHVSLENNGGFSLVEYTFNGMSVKGFSKVRIRLRGDGKDYQFRIRNSSDDYYSFIYTFSTSGEWENIEIPLKEMYPSFRGRKLDMPNFSGDKIEQVAFLIGNKKEQDFKLLIDKIELQ